MRDNKVVLVIIAVILGNGCRGDPGVFAPPLEDGRAARSTAEMHFLRQAAPALPVVYNAGDGDPSAPSSPSNPLETHRREFWAVRGEEVSISINYANGSEFLRFTVPAGGLQHRPDGARFEYGDSVLISVQVDSSLLLLEFLPSGLMFDADRPASLTVSYAGADPDLNGDGVVDEVDWDIARSGLAMWMQQETDDPWFHQGSEHDVDGKRFTGWLRHFSNYAVSW